MGEEPVDAALEELARAIDTEAGGACEEAEETRDPMGQAEVDRLIRGAAGTAPGPRHTAGAGDRGLVQELDGELDDRERASLEAVDAGADHAAEQIEDVDRRGAVEPAEEERVDRLVVAVILGGEEVRARPGDAG